MPDGFKLDKSVSLGVLIHLAVLVVTITLAWSAFDRRTTILELQVSEQSKTIQDIKAQTNRIERYLMAQDPQYWRKAKENGDN